MAAHGRRRIRVVIGLAAASLSVVACSSEPPPRGRVLLVGIDGATLRIVSPLLAEGKLPHLAELARRGVSGPLRSSRPLLSPAIWATIATGKSRHKHGILAFVRRDQQGRKWLLQSSDRKTHALWNIASDAGLTVGVVNWWNTFPPEKIRGIMVSDHAFPGQLERRARLFKAAAETQGHVAFPERWTQKLLQLIASDETLTTIDDRFLNNDDLPRWVRAKGLSKVYHRDHVVMRVALAIEREIQPDLLMVYLKGIDALSHVFWASVEPSNLYPPQLRPSPSVRKAGAKTLRKYYEYTDELIGVLMGRYASDDLVMIVSDHGFEAGVTGTTLPGIHESEKAIDGVVFARGPGLPRGLTAGFLKVSDVTPTILAWLGLPVAEDMDGAPAPFLNVERVERIATYDTHAIERMDGGSSGAEEEILEELQALGYIE